ncbi:MAG: CHAT domain-containing protein [Bacteroidota bacterium]
MGKKSFILLAFANDREGEGRFLTELSKERANLMSILQSVMVPLVKSVASGDSIKEIFRDYKEELSIFHYGGHAEKEGLQTELDELNQEAYSHISGLAKFMGLQDGLRLAFLNGCNTIGQCDEFHKAGIPCVIGTTRKIGDREARRFSEEFYKSLAKGGSIQQSFEEASASIESILGKESLFRNFETEEEQKKSSGNFPYELKIKAGAEEIANQGIKDWEKIDRIGESKGIIEPPKPSGEKTYLLCDRHEHNNLFEDELQFSLKDQKRKPQFFFLHGVHEELPGSLADRFFEFTVRDVLKRLNEPINPGKYFRYEMGFPKSSDFDSKRNRDLAFIRLQNHFDSQDLDLPENGRDVLKRVGSHRRLVLFQHDIMAKDWHEEMPTFMERYISDFWNLELKSNQPQVIVVFNLTYNLAKGLSGLFKKRIDKQIEKKLETLSKLDNCLLIDRLESVSSDDVAAWQGDYLKQKPELVRDLFGNKNKLPMAEIEAVLIRELKKM